ncbi:peptidase S8 [Microbacterium foliorum]|uniref:Peptidase S8 n=1 Tax=Microbacterium foliorum TaxID=104336 RepID=A0A4Y5YLP4_9MICO|nr:S8 family serine peptidase [Microbacterium foliorum]QDE33731.1 peptidase S8 [Microbacterium foliorum]
MRRRRAALPTLLVGAIALGAILSSAPASAAAPSAPTASTARSLAAHGSAVPAATAGDACTPGTVVYSPEAPQALALLGAEEANRVATGRGVVVAIVDSGIDAGNPHLAGVVIGGVDLVGDGERADGLTDTTGHGTAIAGQIAAQPVDGSGVVGLAPDAQLLSVRVFRSDQQQDKDKGFGPTSQRIADGIHWAADNGADIINVSMSQTTDSPDLRAAVEHASAVGALVVASGGNRASDPDAEDGPRYPAAYEQVLGVSAADPSGRANDASIHGPQVGVTAPGMNVLSAALGGGDCIFAADAPASSFATGYASAAAALVAEAHPEDPPAGWAYRLTATALRDDADKRDDVNGWGFIQPFAAIELLPDETTRGPVSPYFDTTESAARPPAAAVDPDHGASPFLLTREAALFTTIGGATLLGVLGILIVLRRRREQPAVDPAEAEREGGLLNSPGPGAGDERFG